MIEGLSEQIAEEQEGACTSSMWEEHSLRGKDKCGCPEAGVLLMNKHNCKEAIHTQWDKKWAC